MTIDVNDAEPQREFGEVIPDGTFVRVAFHIEPGGTTLPNIEADAALFTESKTSDAVGLTVDLTVVWPEAFANRKIFGDTFWTVSGGSVDASGISKGWKFTKTRIRAAINSCMGLDPKDDGVKARAIRNLASFSALDGLEFFARLSVIPGDPAPSGGNYPDKNGLYHIVEPNEPEWALLQQHQEIPPQPVNLRPRGLRPGAAVPAAAGPVNPGGWQGGAGPAMGAAVAQAEAGWGTKAVTTAAPISNGQSWVASAPGMPPQQASNATNTSLPEAGQPVAPPIPGKPNWLKGT